MPPARFKDLALDAVDHQALADWWCAALGYRRRNQEEDGRTWPADWPVPIHDPEGEGPSIWINPVPEAKSGKNRMHLDVRGDTDELLALGASLIRTNEGATVTWDVLADPEGNEFCVFPPEPPVVVPPTVR
ncbi:VOC family protein [Streptomyces sp. NBRC 109706]|uniref:VOC family protein n=1 Tax=Streptomyces sp. NBRC 109706 TaxID=1550035 RepID=UPI000784CF9D|nr:VOC family protein [Streptomyces sp. NBRC 109706]